MTVQEAHASTLEGCWHNQLGTRLAIAADAEGVVTGEIRSEVGGVEGDQAVRGYVAPWPAPRGVIGLVVRWEGTHSVTTWSGHFDLEHGVISANWLLTSADFGQNEWQATRTGSDTFHRDAEHGPPDGPRSPA